MSGASGDGEGGGSAGELAALEPLEQNRGTRENSKQEWPDLLKATSR